MDSRCSTHLTVRVNDPLPGHRRESIPNVLRLFPTAINGTVSDSCQCDLSRRKEVIQPHFPVRLPCYDFTPLTRRTFGAVLQFRLDKRLRVPPTRVV